MMRSGCAGVWSLHAEPFSDNQMHGWCPQAWSLLGAYGANSGSTVVLCCECAVVGCPCGVLRGGCFVVMLPLDT